MKISSSYAAGSDICTGIAGNNGNIEIKYRVGRPEYSLVAWICYARAVSGTYDSAEKEYDHKKIPRIETLHFHRHFASCVTSGP